MAQKKIESGNFVIPGDILGVEEEFMPGDYAFVDGGVVYSAATGQVQFDDRSRKVSVRPTTKLPPVPLDGEIVLAKVSYMRGQFARMEIFAIEGEAGRQIPSAPEGAVHISQARRDYVKDLESEFQLGDIVRARVINQDRDPIMLSTADDELGVVLAKCKECHQVMVVKGNRLYCETCDAYEKRKVATVYGSVPI